MKRTLILMVLILGAGVLMYSCKQGAKNTSEEKAEKAVPEAVTKAFEAKFVGATDVEWEQEEEGVYEAEFKVNGQEMSAEFASDGTWKETEQKVDHSQLPAAVVDTLEAGWGDYTVEEVEMCETPEGKTWEVELKKDDQEIELVIDENGKVIKQEEEKEGEEEVGEASEENEKAEKEEEEGETEESEQEK